MAALGRLLKLRDEPRSSGGEFQSWPARQQHVSILDRVKEGFGGGGGGGGNDSSANDAGQRRRSGKSSHNIASSASSGRAPPPPVDEPVFAPSMTPEAKSYGIYAYGTTLLESGQHAKALGCYNRALVLQRDALGANHAVTGRTLRSIGTCLLGMGGEQSFAALTALEEALFIRQLDCGDGADDDEARLITEDIWSLLHKKRSSDAATTNRATPGQARMLRDMRKQASVKELQSFVIRSVRRRGSMFSGTDSVRDLQPDGDGHDDEDYRKSENDATNPPPSSERQQEEAGDEIELDLIDAVKPTRANEQGPAMKRIGENSGGGLHFSKDGSMDLGEALSCLETELAKQDVDVIAHKDHGSSFPGTNKPPQKKEDDNETRFWKSSTNNAFNYSGTSFRNNTFGDLGDRWAKEADDCFDSLEAYDSLRREAMEKVQARSKTSGAVIETMANKVQATGRAA